MKNKILKCILGVSLIVLLAGCNSRIKNLDAKKFKSDYEKLNLVVNNSGVEFRTVEINEQNPYKYSSAKEILEKIDKKETFYVYFGDTQCPWCRSVIEKSIEVANDLKINTIYYVNIWDNDHNEILRDKYQLNSKNEPELIQEGTKEYYDLLKVFDNVLKDYTLTDSKGNTIDLEEKRIFAPNFIYVENGVARKCESAISSLQKDSHAELTDEIKADEEKLFREFFAN